MQWVEDIGILSPLRSRVQRIVDERDQFTGIGTVDRLGEALGHNFLPLLTVVASKSRGAARKVVLDRLMIDFAKQYPEFDKTPEGEDPETYDAKFWSMIEKDFNREVYAFMTRNEEAKAELARLIKEVEDERDRVLGEATPEQKARAKHAREVRVKNLNGRKRRRPKKKIK